MCSCACKQFFRYEIFRSYCSHTRKVFLYRWGIRGSEGTLSEESGKRGMKIEIEDWKREISDWMLHTPNGETNHLWPKRCLKQTYRLWHCNVYWIHITEVITKDTIKCFVVSLHETQAERSFIKCISSTKLWTASQMDSAIQRRLVELFFSPKLASS